MEADPAPPHPIPSPNPPLSTPPDPSLPPNQLQSDAHPAPSHPASPPPQSPEQGQPQPGADGPDPEPPASSPPSPDEALEALRLTASQQASELSALETHLSDAQSEAAKLQEQVADQTRRKAELEARLDEERKTAQVTSKDLNDLKNSTVPDLLQSVEETSRAKAELESQLAAEQERARELEKEKEAVAEKASAASKELEATHADVERRAEEVAAQQSLLDEQRRKFEEEKAAHEKLMAELATLSKERAEAAAAAAARAEAMRAASVTLQCWSRQYLARLRVKAAEFQAALTAIRKEESSVVLQCLIRSFVARRRVAFLKYQKHLAFVNATALTIQCAARVRIAYLKANNIRDSLEAERLHREREEKERLRLEAAAAARERDRKRTEEERAAAEKQARWLEERTNRQLQFIARDTIRRHGSLLSGRISAHLPPPLAPLLEILHCLHRFPADTALAADGLKALTLAASSSPAACFYILEEGGAAVLQGAMEADGGGELHSVGEKLSTLFCGADDLKRAMPLAFEADIRKLQALAPPGLPEKEFWDAHLESLSRVPDDGDLPDEQSEMKLGPELSSPIPENTISNMNFESYSMSPENSLYMNSIFSVEQTAPFDLTVNLRAPPVVPPPMDLEAVKQLREAGELAIEEEEKKEGGDNLASGSFLHTPYAVPLRRPKKSSKKKKKGGREESGYRQPAGAGLNQFSSVLTDSMATMEGGSQIMLAEPSLMSEPPASPTEAAQQLRPHTSTGGLRNARVSVSAAPLAEEDGNEMMFFDSGEQVLVLGGNEPQSQPEDSRPATAPSANEPETDTRTGVFSPWQDNDAGGAVSFGRASPDFTGFSEPTVTPKRRKPRPPPLDKNAPSLELSETTPKKTPKSGKKKKKKKKAEEGAEGAEGAGEVEEEKEKAEAEEPPYTPLPRMEGTEFFNKRLQNFRSTTLSPTHNAQLTPVHHMGPTPEKLVKHSTVQKIFENAAPPKVVERHRYARNPLSPTAGAAGSAGRLGRRHSVRDMAQIFQILDEEDVGCIPAPKFANALMAMSGLNVKKEEVQKLMSDFGVEMDADHIDYEEFVSTGNILRVKKHARLAPNSVPFGPWTAQTSRPTPERSPHIAVTWQKHVKWYQKRREHAVLWLMKRAVVAQKHLRVQRKVGKLLQHRGRQAEAVLRLQEQAKEAMTHFELRVKAAMKLRERCRKAAKFKKRQEMAHASLKAFVRHENVAKLIAKFEQRNYNSVYYLAYKRKIAFEFLLAAGRHSVAHYLEQQAIVIWLHETAETAKVQYLKCVDSVEWLTARSARALETWEMKDAAVFELRRKSMKYMRIWDTQKQVLRDLHEAGGRAVVHTEKVQESYGKLKSRGDTAKVYAEKFEEAKEFLRKWGYESSHHTQLQEEAKEWLAEKVQGVIVIKERRDTAQKALEKSGTHAKRHCVGTDKARAALAKRVELSRQRTIKQEQCRLDLEMFTDDARLQLHKQALLLQCPGTIKEKEKEIKARDKEKEKERRDLDASKRFEAEMEDAFEFFDTDGGGEIDRIEFRHMLNSGHLITIPPDEIEDCYSQIDKDGSGGVDFHEFFAWFNYEFSHEKHHGRKESFRVANIIPIKQRALRMMLPQFVAGEMKDDFGQTIPAPGHMQKTADGIDDRWWLDEIEKGKKPFAEYLERKEKQAKEAEEEKKMEEEREKERERVREMNMTHEEKVERRKEREKEARKKTEEMKKQMAERRRREILAGGSGRGEVFTNVDGEGGGGGGGGKGGEEGEEKFWDDMNGEWVFKDKGNKEFKTNVVERAAQNELLDQEKERRRSLGEEAKARAAAERAAAEAEGVLEGGVGGEGGGGEEGGV